MEDWIEHLDGECPVADGVIVDVKLMDNTIMEYIPAEQFYWKPDQVSADWNITHWRLSSKVTTIMDKPTEDKPIVSDGSSSSYYTFDITNKAGQTITVEVGDVCRAMVDNDFDLTNIIKACRRVSEASQGRGKSGTSIEYDCNKMVYFSNEYKHWNKGTA